MKIEKDNVRKKGNKLRSTDDAKPKRVALLGATGAYGNGVLRRAIANGIEIVAIVRNPEKLKVPVGPGSVTVIKAELDDINTLTKAFHGVDGVISTISMGVKAKRGAFSPKSKNSNIYKAMKAASINKLVVVSGASSPVPGEWLRPVTWIRYGISHLFLPAGLIKENIIESKELFYGENGSDGIDWVIARATRVNTHREYIGAEVSEKGTVTPIVGAEDVGEFCLFAVASKEYNRKAPIIGTRKY